MEYLMESTRGSLPADRLLLDPNNYRFHDIASYRRVTNRVRYGESGVQERTLQLLQTTAAFELEALKDSILTNGYVPLEQIVIEEYSRDDHDEPLYLVIEGNRRVAAVKSLLAEHGGGSVDIPDEMLATLNELPVIIISGLEEERQAYRQTLMAIRHIAGISEWGPYQQAKLIVELFDKEEHQFGRVAQRIGISSREVARRYRASKALQQMEEDDEFGDYAEPKLYTFFHEAVSQPKVREWLKWSDETFTAQDLDAKRAFYELLSPRKVEDQVLPAKLQNASRHIRQLKDIVDKPNALKILVDPEEPFENAVRAAESVIIEDESGLLEKSLAMALNALREPSIDAWLAPTEKARQIWSEITSFVDKVRNIIGQ
jgi:hypothetical protein